LGRRREANIFYELYLEDAAGKLANVPVLIKNFRAEGDAFPNQGTDRTKWIFSRRFLIYDTVSGVRAGSFASDIPEVVRWASDIKLKVTMVQDEQDSGKKLLRPYLIVDYSERDVSTISPSERVQASLQVDYFSDYGPTLTSALTAFCILFVVALFFAGLRIYMFLQRNPRSALMASEGGAAHLLMAVYYILDTWSKFMYVLLGMTTLVITWTYKGQESAALLLPELGEASNSLYQAFYGVFGATLVARAAANLLRIRQQAKADIYLVDLERPRPGTNEVNAWRTIFLANEWAELQCELRVIEPDTAFIWFLFFWVGLGWQHHCGADPDSTNEADPIVKQNVLLKFFWVALIFYGVGVGRVGAAFVASASGSDVIGQFIDLATLSNVSLLVMDEPVHGYYIHGQAPWGKADIPLDMMQKQLQEEEAGGAGERARGLKHQETASKLDRVQAFEIYLPKSLRESLAKARARTPADSQLELAGGFKAKAQAKRVAGEDYDEDEAPGEAAPLAPNAGWSRKERAIRQEEYRKNKVSELLRANLGDALQAE
jgi:meckelin